MASLAANKKTESHSRLQILRTDGVASAN